MSTASGWAINQLDVSEKLESEFILELEQNAGIIYKINRIYSSDTEDEQDLRQESFIKHGRLSRALKADRSFLPGYTALP